VIRAEQRKNVMIAKEKHGIEVNMTQIAEEPDISKPIRPASQSKKEEGEKNRKILIFKGMDSRCTLN
jgi:hypothetical protein